VLRFFVVSLLFSKDFYPGEILFSTQFPGDLFKGLAWAIGIWLVPKMKLRAFVILEIILNLNMIFIFYFLNSVMGADLKWVSLAYLTAYIVHFMLTYVFTRRELGYRLGHNNLKLLLLGLSLIVIVILLSQYSLIWGYVIALPVLAIWMSLAIKKHEYVQLKNIVMSKLNR
jgi:hypothetical protein